MPKRFSFGDASIDVDASGQQIVEPPEPETPFRILILGDFSGRASRGISEADLKGRRPMLVDRDNLEEVLAKLRPELRLSPEISIPFRELDDFHPDRIFTRVGLFSALHDMRERVKDPVAFREAWADLLPKAPPAPADAPPTKVSLGELVDETESREAAQPARALDSFSALLRDIVAPHLVPSADPRQAGMMAKVDAATADVMRGLLHNADFQALEAAWRGLSFLLRRLETDVALKVYVLDVSKAELAADLTRASSLRQTGLFRVMVTEAVEIAGAEPWAVVGGLYTFDNSVADVTLLGYLGGIATAAHAPFLAAAAPVVVGAKSFGETPEVEKWRPAAGEAAQAWRLLRSLPEARHLGLALPRFLLRLPYGKKHEPIESFEFEEVEGSPKHDEYLWGNPALACLCLLGEAFADAAWDLRPGSVRELDGLPAHIYKQDGEAHMKPCAEALMTDKAVDAMLEQGLMPLVSIRDRDKAVLMRFQSLAEPLAPLAGRWAS